MRKRLLIVGFTVLLSVVATAQQEYPRAEVYAGFTYLRIPPPGKVNAYNAVGGIGQVEYNINEAIGIVGDLGGVTNGNITGHGFTFPGDQTQFNYLFGPRVTYLKTHKFQPFAHFLIGGVHNSRSFSVPNSAIPATAVVPRGVTVEPGTTHTKFRSTQNAFAYALGGGMDIAILHALSIRPFEIDYMPTKFSPFNFSTSGTEVFPGFNDTRWQHNLRVSFGVSFRL